MSKPDFPLAADDVLIFAGQIARLAPSDAEWVRRLWLEMLRARASEAELLAARSGRQPATDDRGEPLGDHLAQVALDTAEWLRTLWEVGYMGAGNFRSQPRSAFPSIDLEDVRKSSLFLRIRQGKHALPFPPPTRHGVPWHELLEGPEQTHAVDAEILRDEAGRPLAAIIEGCAEWQVIDETADQREFVVQHRGKGPTYRLWLNDDFTGDLQRQAPSSTCNISRQERGGFHSYTLEWSDEAGHTQLVALRAVTWERAESEAQHWLATTHPDRYGRIRFARCEA